MSNRTVEMADNDDPLLRLTSLRGTRPRVTPTRHRWRSLRVNTYLFAFLGLLLILGTVQVSQMAGLWTTSGKVTAGGEKVAATGANPDEIKGWMTIDEVLKAYNVPQADFYAKFGIPADVPVTAQLKDLESVAESFSVTDLRTWLTERMAAAGMTPAPAEQQP
ncbi:MAG: hypothetical protein ACYC1C_12485 [Chloroflexota bacterium]